ncbi:MAG: DEAD/DEAH box helicase family protein [Planctomycetes bacterium]|nr:DEAD/DEAH box helicase family protein [Planctomycetota bacterium]
MKRWREVGHPSDHPTIAEIFEYATDEGGAVRYLRHPQLAALETYWYLRLVERTPHMFELYRRLYARQSELLPALGLDQDQIRDYVMDEGITALWGRIKTDDGFVRDFRLEALRETLLLDYPSYILALAMGAGKTVLIGAIMATEFAMALEYADGPFVQNALVFAPGKTIIESLRELAEIPYEKILPPRLHRAFAASVKLTFTRDGEKDIPVIRGSSWNIVVTNTEKIRIQKETIRKSDMGDLFAEGKEDEVRQEIANLRLQAIASLPHLAVFSDEAHHTYGQSLGAELKKVRKTVDYLAEKTNVIAVVNTTGTPYFERQPLRDVVIWYGLSQGIRDDILKDLSGNIQAYDFEGDAGKYVAHVVENFFRDYGDVRLPNGAAARLAIYFPQNDDLKELRPVVEKTLVRLGLSPEICLVNTSDETLTKVAEIDAFNRLNDPRSPQRVILLVNKGTEGWNCPSLFACALARRLKTSNNFVLQAATRCLRQVPGNTVKARVYLSTDNFKILDRQLQETYGESIRDLAYAGHETARARIVLRKVDLPALVVTQMVRTVVRREETGQAIRLERPTGSPETLRKTVYTTAETGFGVLQAVEAGIEIEAEPEGIDAYAAAVDLVGQYRLDLWAVLDEIRRLYGGEEVPLAHLGDLARQIEEAARRYEVREEKVEVALALVRPEGFVKELDASNAEVYTAEIVYPKDREELILRANMVRENLGGYGFHYDPYNFDSRPERAFFETLLAQLHLKPSDVEDILFTGALTDPEMTDFFVEYKDEKGRMRRYTPDFVIRKKNGRVLIVEVKAERERAHPIDGEKGKKAMAVRAWRDLNPERLKYEIIFTPAETITADQMRGVLDFVREGSA